MCGGGGRHPGPPRYLHAYLYLHRRGPCWLQDASPRRGAPGPGETPCPGLLGLGSHRNARAGVPGPGRPLGGCGPRCAYLHGVAGHVLAPPARGARAELGAAGGARLRPTRSVEGGEGAGTTGPQPGARPSPACSAPALPGQAAVSARRALRPQRPPGPSRDRRGRRRGSGRGQWGGAPSGPRGCGVPPVLRPLSAATSTSFLFAPFCIRFLLTGYPFERGGTRKE